MNTLLDEPHRKRDLPFQIFEGSPTITFTTDEGHYLFPYFSMSAARMDKDGNVIQLQCQDSLVSLTGNHLDLLWQELQLQNVREVKCSPRKETADCRVDSILIETMEPNR